jgi:hypothetical protein
MLRRVCVVFWNKVTPCGLPPKIPVRPPVRENRGSPIGLIFVANIELGFVVIGALFFVRVVG